MFAHTSIIVVKFGMCLARHNQNRMQKLQQNIVARIITNMSSDIDHSIALHALSWEPLKIVRKKQT